MRTWVADEAVSRVLGAIRVGYPVATETRRRRNPCLAACSMPYNQPTVSVCAVRAIHDPFGAYGKIPVNAAFVQDSLAVEFRRWYSLRWCAA